MGTFEQTYKDNVKATKETYANAKKFHAKGIESLKREFGYHPIFKRPGDTFSATPWRPRA